MHKFFSRASVLIAALCAATPQWLSSQPTTQSVYFPIKRQYLALPSGVQPLLPTFAADGQQIFFQNAVDATAWIIRTDGTDVHCITCTFSDRPETRGGFLHAFGDGKRLMLTRGVAGPVGLNSGYNAWVLECAKTVRDCDSHRFLPVDLSASQGRFPVLQQRTWHLAPDDQHIGWMEVRSDGTVMIVARLERRQDRYVALDPRVVNPRGPSGTSDHNADHWENLSQLYELKSFTPDGRGILAVGLPNNNVDVLRIDLVSGRTTRLTAHPDWDEDGSLSPDQSLLVVNSWRGAHRLDALAWLPQVRGFTGLMTGAAIAPYYVSTWSGFQCDLSPWLLTAKGDDGGHRLGQPIDVYGGGLTAANNVHGHRVWSPDSTMLLLQERTKSQGSWAPSRIAIAQLGRAPTRPVGFVTSRVGPWALPAAIYEGPHATERTVVAYGNVSGRAVITYRGTLASGPMAAVTFDRFSDDGATFVSGTMSGSSGSGGGGEKRLWTLLADVTVFGRHQGTFAMDLTIDNAAKPLPAMTGSIHAVYDGKVAPPLPSLGPCYDRQPVATPLRLEVTRARNDLRVAVTADIGGDRRPVENATIQYGTRHARTDVNGTAVLQARSGISRIQVTAGDTFLPASAIATGSSPLERWMRQRKRKSPN